MRSSGQFESFLFFLQKDFARTRAQKAQKLQKAQRRNQAKAKKAQKVQKRK